MKNKNRLIRIIGVLITTLVLVLFIAPDIAEARRGSRSFGGSRRSITRPKSRTTKPRTRTQARKTVPPSKRSSFGGTRMASSRDYTSKYGTPRKSTPYTGKNAAGQSQRYVMHSYGGYGSGLMTGYMMGTTSWMWAMPFHPAFYYSRPYYVSNPDGTMGVYPPTFSWSKLFFTLLIVGGIIYIIIRVIKNKRSRNYSQSSFG